jgi:23S rRNA (guanosine2251-2'-O)-methyltransferase
MAEIISGRNPVRELLRAGTQTVNKVLLSRQARGEAITEIITLAKDRGIPLHHVPPEKFDKICPENSQGVAAEVSNFEYLELNELWDKVKSKPNPVLVVLDGIEDPHNLGAIIRNAVVFGADGIIIAKWRSAAVNDTVARTSAGAIEHIPVARVANIPQAISDLKDMNIWVVGAEGAGSKSIRSEKFAFPMAIVIGSEGEGLHDLVKKRCDYLVSIPQTDKISSLNASCAAAVVLYEVYLQKTAASKPA